MPSNKDFKRLVRERMQKTGESYTAARAQFTKKPDYAVRAGHSETLVRKKTGRGWAEWVEALDAVQAHGWKHGAIAEHLRTTYRVPPWWVQAVTVGYERIKGLREIGQSRDGSYSATKSKTFAVPVSRLFRAFSHAATRARWLPGTELRVRTAIRNRSLRVTWSDGTSVEIGFAAKGRSKAQVALAHGKLPDKAAVARMKAYWSERLTALAELLA